MSSFNPKKFVFFETFTNQNGKTSGSGFIGVILGLTAVAAFVAAMVGWFLKIPEVIPVMEEILQMVMAVTVLLGVRKVSGDFREAKIAVKQVAETTTTSTSTNTSTSNQSNIVPVQPVPQPQPDPKPVPPVNPDEIG